MTERKPTRGLKVCEETATDIRKSVATWLNDYGHLRGSAVNILRDYARNDASLHLFDENGISTHPYSKSRLPASGPRSKNYRGSRGTSTS